MWLAAPIMTDTPDWSLVLHGGAGSIERHRLTEAQDSGVRAALALALDTGAAILSEGGGALDAVEAAVRVLEEDPHFNAGRGAAFTREGTIELDAAIMDGRTRAAGARPRSKERRSPCQLRSRRRPSRGSGNGRARDRGRRRRGEAGAGA